jgi:hypothetical protein
MPVPDDPSELDVDSSFHLEVEGAEAIELGPLVDALMEDLPEFMPTYRGLFQACDDDPGEPVVLMELADFVTARLAVLVNEGPLVERALAVVETLIDSLGDDEIGCEMVGLAFFDSFSFEERQLLAPWLGPRSRSLLDALDVSPLD